MDKSFALIAAALITIPIGIGTVLAQTEDTDQATPNLVPTGLERSPADPSTGENVTFTATVTNDGNASAGNFIVQFFLDGDQLGDNITVVGLDANESAELSSEGWNATQGDHNATVIVDAGEDVNESNEEDNELTGAFTVDPEAAEHPDHADLAAGEPSLDPTDPAPGDDVTFTATVSNDGNVSVGNFTVQFLLDGEQLGENITVEGLGANGSTEVTSEAWNATEGDHNVTVIADAGDDVDESDESNNQATISFTLEAPPEDPDEGDEREEGDEGDEDKDQEATQITICHRPPGNPDNEHTITIGEPAWQAHEGHGDHMGPCEGDADHEDHDDNEASTSGHDDGDASPEEDGNETEPSEQDGDEPERSDEDEDRGPPDHAKANGRRGR